MLMAILSDNYFHHSNQYQGKYNRRWTVRAFAYDEEGNLMMLKLKGQDMLGKRNCVETIGGSIHSDETTEEALKRIIRDECGCSIKDMQSVGYIVDHYNALNRETISNYFIVKLGPNEYASHLENQEEGKISAVIKVKPDDVVPLLKNVKKGTFDDLITRRDLVAYNSLKKRNLL